jgi:hypothetical protein
MFYHACSAAWCHYPVVFSLSFEDGTFFNYHFLEVLVLVCM